MAGGSLLEHTCRALAWRRLMQLRARHTAAAGEESRLRNRWLTLHTVACETYDAYTKASVDREEAYEALRFAENITPVIDVKRPKRKAPDPGYFDDEDIPF